MSKQPQILMMNEVEILQYANRGYLQENQVVKSGITKKKYRILNNTKMPQSFEELQNFGNAKFILKEF